MKRTLLALLALAAAVAPSCTKQDGTPQNGTIALRFPEWTAGN